MAMPKSNLDDLMKNPQAAALLKNKELIAQLLSSPDTKKLMDMLTQKAGDGGLKGAAEAAAKGDPSKLMGMMNGLMNSKEGAEVVERINKNLPPK